MSDDFRWLGRVTYSSENGPIEVDFHFEELAEHHNLVERGPDWNLIETIGRAAQPAARHSGESGALASLTRRRPPSPVIGVLGVTSGPLAGLPRDYVLDRARFANHDTP